MNSEHVESVVLGGNGIAQKDTNTTKKRGPRSRFVKQVKAKKPMTPEFAADIKRQTEAKIQSDIQFAQEKLERLRISALNNGTVSAERRYRRALTSIKAHDGTRIDSRRDLARKTDRHVRPKLLAVERVRRMPALPAPTVWRPQYRINLDARLRTSGGGGIKDAINHRFNRLPKGIVLLGAPTVSVIFQWTLSEPRRTDVVTTAPTTPVGTAMLLLPPDHPFRRIKNLMTRGDVYLMDGLQVVNAETPIGILREPRELVFRSVGLMGGSSTNKNELHPWTDSKARNAVKVTCNKCGKEGLVKAECKKTFYLTCKKKTERKKKKEQNNPPMSCDVEVAPVGNPSPPIPAQKPNAETSKGDSADAAHIIIEIPEDPPTLIPMTLKELEAITPPHESSRYSNKGKIPEDELQNSGPIKQHFPTAKVGAVDSLEAIPSMITTDENQVTKQSNTVITTTTSIPSSVPVVTQISINMPDYVIESSNKEWVSEYQPSELYDVLAEWLKSSKGPFYRRCISDCLTFIYFLMMFLLFIMALRGSVEMRTFLHLCHPAVDWMVDTLPKKRRNNSGWNLKRWWWLLIITDTFVSGLHLSLLATLINGWARTLYKRFSFILDPRVPYLAKPIYWFHQNHQGLHSNMYKPVSEILSDPGLRAVFDEIALDRQFHRWYVMYLCFTPWEWSQFWTKSPFYSYTNVKTTYKTKAATKYSYTADVRPVAWQGSTLKINHVTYCDIEAIREYKSPIVKETFLPDHDGYVISTITQPMKICLNMFDEIMSLAKTVSPFEDAGTVQSKVLHNVSQLTYINYDAQLFPNHPVIMDTTLYIRAAILSMRQQQVVHLGSGEVKLPMLQ